MIRVNSLIANSFLKELGYAQRSAILGAGKHRCQRLYSVYDLGNNSSVIVEKSSIASEWFGARGVLSSAPLSIC